jgi:hypothetical protein
MISTLPAVQAFVSRVYITDNARRVEKRIANRRHRRALNRATRRFVIDPESFDDEGFNAPSLSAWDLD